MVQVNQRLDIPEEELTFRASRSSGPGGQNVNKVNTRIELLFDVATSPSLSDWQRQRICSRLANRIDGDGTLRVVAQDHRTQAANRAAAVERFAALLAEALHVQKTRRPTRVPRKAKERRLEGKRRVSAKKKDRSWRPE